MNCAKQGQSGKTKVSQKLSVDLSFFAKLHGYQTRDFGATISSFCFPAPVLLLANSVAPPRFGLLGTCLDISS
ncbi:MAG: hypothetical protein IPM82_04755 [Saprospiraceae bacterium]|nr:hypothetical protein [Saprospiraceae bacterium]